MAKKHLLAKTISWRFIATFTTILLVFTFTGELTLSIGLGVVEVITKLILYYGHERIWERIV